MKLEHEIVLERLGIGEENARTAKDLKFSPRTLRKMVEEMRRDGVPICSTNNGYFIALTYEEAAGTINRMMAMANNTMDSAENLRRCFNEEGLWLDYMN